MALARSIKFRVVSPAGPSATKHFESLDPAVLYAQDLCRRHGEVTYVDERLERSWVQRQRYLPMRSST